MKLVLPMISGLLLLSGCTTAHVFSETLHARLHNDPAMLVKNGIPAETGRWGLWAMTYRSSSDCGKVTKKALTAAVAKDLDPKTTLSQSEAEALQTLQQKDICSPQVLKPSTTDPATAR